MSTKTNDFLCDREAEKAVLGSMMTETTVVPHVIALLGHNSDAFFTVDHQLIYGAILTVYDRIAKVDPLLVADELKRADQLNRMGGSDYLYELQAPIVETESTEFYANIIKEKHTRRRLVSAGNSIQEVAKDETLELGEVINQSQESVFEIGQSEIQRGFQKVGPIITKSIDKIEQLFGKQERHLGLPTGFVEFDNMTSGLQPGELVIIAARPSMGKTTLVLNIAQNISIEQQRPVAIFSLEMPAQDVVLRMLSAEAHIDFGRLRTGNFEEEYWKPLTEASVRLSNAPILVNDNRGLTIQTLRAEGRRLKGEYDNLSLIIVDYIQLLKGVGRYNSREQEISEISRALKVLAWELDLPVVACSQLSREVERRPNKQPQLSDLRESGAIEQDADLVAFLYREDYYDEEESVDERVEADLMIKKQRNGPTGTAMLYFTKKQMRFDNPN